VELLAKESGGYPGHVVLDDDVVLPDSAAEAIARARAAREAALNAAAAATTALADAVRLLTELDLSTRDAGYLLGISHARVQQIAAPNPPTEDS